MAKAFNLFANIDEFSSSDNNYSFAELETSNHETVSVETKPLRQSRKRKNQAAKSNIKSKVTLDVIDADEIDADEIGNNTVVSPGVGQKTAFKKLSQLKKNLETALTEPSKRQTHTDMTVSLREDYQRMRSKRARVAANVQNEYVEEYAPSAALRQNVGNESIDEEELSVSIKLKWEGTSKIEKIPFSLYKTFNELIVELSTRDKIDARSFLLMFGNNVIRQDDSPHSIGYTLGKFISVRVVDNPSSYIPESTSKHENTIEVKIQCPQWKKPIQFNIKKTDKFKVLAGMCSEKLKCRQEQLRFKFDGDIINISSTPEDLDFEGGEIIDLIISD